MMVTDFCVIHQRDICLSCDGGNHCKAILCDRSDIQRYLDYCEWEECEDE